MKRTFTCDYSHLLVWALDRERAAYHMWVLTPFHVGFDNEGERARYRSGNTHTSLSRVSALTFTRAIYSLFCSVNDSWTCEYHRRYGREIAIRCKWGIGTALS